MADDYYGAGKFWIRGFAFWGNSQLPWHFCDFKRKLKIMRPVKASGRGLYKSPTWDMESLAGYSAQFPGKQPLI
ncbi:MAG: hypothetical protein AAFX53_01575 [Bacteroidota bacterium]